jgi:hypothetical protein
VDLTPIESAWQQRLIQLAGDASDDALPCIENVLLALIRVLELPRLKQLQFARTVAALTELASE